MLSVLPCISHNIAMHFCFKRQDNHQVCNVQYVVIVPYRISLDVRTKLTGLFLSFGQFGNIQNLLLKWENYETNPHKIWISQIAWLNLDLNEFPLENHFCLRPSPCIWIKNHTLFSDFSLPKQIGSDRLILNFGHINLLKINILIFP